MNKHIKARFYFFYHALEVFHSKPGVEPPLEHYLGRAEGNRLGNLLQDFIMR